MILVILDGWGLAPASSGNAITLSKTPTMDYLAKNYPYTRLEASGRFVGLPANQDGNSEAGHMNIGAGRLTEQDSTRISNNIANGTFFKNPAFMEAVGHARQNKSSIHLMGMLGNNMSAHSDPNHLQALLRFLREQGIKEINLHLFTDGRDSPKYAGLKLINALEKTLGAEETVNTVMGRFYAMDRKKVWSRTELAYNSLTIGKSGKLPCREAPSAVAAITESYNRGESDEFMEPYIITKDGKPTRRIKDGDSVIFFNLRSDRARQIAKVFVQPDFEKLNPGAFKRKVVFKNVRFVAMTDFGPDLNNILSAFPGPDLRETLPKRLGHLSQLYIAESEKYAHVTYFFNGGYADPVAGEKRQLIASPNVRSYDETPAMSSAALTKTVVDNLKKRKFDFTVLNFAAPDMVGHTGNLNAAIKCCHLVDKELDVLVRAYLKIGGSLLVTADHGNIEEMINLETSEIDTEHSTNQVPFILVNDSLKSKINLEEGILGDIAPTILSLLGQETPREMTGKSLIKFKIPPEFPVKAWRAGQS